MQMGNLGSDCWEKKSLWKTSKKPVWSLLCFAQQPWSSSSPYPWCLPELCRWNASAQICTLLLLTPTCWCAFLAWLQLCFVAVVIHGEQLTLATIHGLVGRGCWCYRPSGLGVTLGSGLLPSVEHPARAVPWHAFWSHHFIIVSSGL